MSETLEKPKAESPFYAGTFVQRAWDSTSLGWFKTCPRLYYYSMIEGWRSKREAIDLVFGIHYHKALESYDKLMALDPQHDAAVKTVVRRALIDTWDRATSTPWSPEHVKNRWTLIRSIIWYLDHFKDDAAKTHILQSGAPAVELSFRMQLTEDILLCGHLDRVVDYLDGTYVMDRKTTKTTLSPHYFEGYSPDNQMSLYTAAAKVTYHAPVRGVIIDAAQIAVGFTRFERGIAYRTDAHIEEWLGEALVWTKQAQTMAMTTGGEAAFPQNDKACHLYGGCVFRKVCSKHPQARQTFLEADFHKDPWNPLATR